jgi:hypothetical protein
MVVERVLVMRHGDRYSEPLDPTLTPKGLRQSRQLAVLPQGLYPIFVTLQYSSTTLYQVSYHVFSSCFPEV